MLIDLLKQVISAGRREGVGEQKDGDHYMEKPPEILENDGKAISNSWNLKDLFGMNEPYPDKIIGDDGNISTNQSNPFLDALRKSRENNNTGPGVLRQLLGNVLGGGMVPGTGTVGGDPAGVSKPDHVPGTRQDAALSPTPMKDQRQPNLIPTPQPRPDYSMPAALDPKSIEELRQSLLSDSGQLDPNNPNGLAGRMSGPNSQVDMNNQRKEAMGMTDSMRGFDGSRQAKMKKGN